MVLEMVRSILDVPSDELMQIGDLAKRMLFDPGVESREAAVELFRASLKDMTNEHALIAGMFISGLLRCNLAQQARQCADEAPEGR